MTEFIICGLCGFRGLEIGSTMCFLCNNEKTSCKNKNTRKYIDHIETAPGNDGLEEDKAGLYEQYECKPNTYKLPKHPSKLVESSLLSAIKVTYDDRLLHDNGVIQNKSVSSIQGDTILMILSKFTEYFEYESVNTRCGFFLGDGTGCGKGRIVAGLAKELCVSKNKRKAVWLSVSQDLEIDSKRDLDDVKSNMKTMNLLSRKHDDDGVMFSTYNTLVKRKRYDVLCKWLGDDFDGLLIFDESHKAKQCLNNKSKTASIIVELQNKYPNAHVVYVSATGCSQVEHMGYMIRLNLWGGNSPHESFKEFVNETNMGGDFANEMIAMHLKKNGSYIARSLSYKNVTTGVTLIKSIEFERVYQDSVNVIELIRNSGLIDGKMKMMFGGTILRFFRSLFLSLKIDKTINIIEKCLEENMSAVVTVQSTWETHQTDNTDEFDAPKMTLIKFMEYIHDSHDGNEKLQEMCCGIISEVNKIRFGSNMNAIDAIIKYFGESNTAEITGRKKYYNEIGELVSRKYTNLEGKNMFVNDEKRVCVISEAGSVGISLHDLTGKHRRFHVILELPWSAEQFMQQCGRTHRSGQMSSPHYQIVMTDLPSESRFLSIIMKRLRTLGALTNGNRFIKTDIFNLGEDYESKEGEQALHTILNNGSLGIADREIFGLKCDKVSRFFNRMMMLPIKNQMNIFDAYNKLYVNYCNVTNMRNDNMHIHDVYVSNIEKEESEYINDKVSITTLSIQSTPPTYSKIMNAVKEIQTVKRLIHVTKNTLAIAIKLHKDSDLYRCYTPNSIKDIIVTSEYIMNDYSVYKESVEVFLHMWNTAITIHKKLVDITLVTGSLYEIRLQFNRHNSMKNVKLKKITCIDSKQSSKLGFHVTERMKMIVKQMLE